MRHSIVELQHFQQRQHPNQRRKRRKHEARLFQELPRFQ
jgi:hypothetical protein